MTPRDLRSALTCALATALSLATPLGCTRSARILDVELRSDLRAGFEIDGAVIEFRRERDSTPQRVTASLGRDADLLTGHRLAAVSGITSESGLLRVDVLRGSHLVARQELVVDTRENRLVRVVISRSCAGITCPGGLDDPEATACVSGTCTTPDCAAGMGAACTVDECTAPSECSGVGCAQASCAEGECLADLDDSMCPTGFHCSLSGDCQEGEYTFDAGPDSGMNGDAGVVRDGALADGAVLDGSMLDGGPFELTRNYCPDRSLTRGQAAKFFVKFYRKSGRYLPMPVTMTSFRDVEADARFADFIEESARTGLAEPCDGDAELFCASRNITRGELARVFLRAFFVNPEYAPPAATGRFTDVGAEFAPWVEEFVNRGYLDPCGAMTYCPDEPIRRDEVARIIIRGLRGFSNDPTEVTGLFDDVDPRHPLAPWIEIFARDGFTNGC